jgi:hypothetical protein
MDLAPVVLFTYNRLDHLTETIESLKENIGVDLTDIFIYSDAAKNSLDEKPVSDVRHYLTNLSGFKSITIIEREKNWGLADNIIDGVTAVVNRYGKVIVLEDDVVSSKYFLQFMNAALTRYRDNPKVMQISGYSHGINKEGLPDFYFLRLCDSWGWATWADRWQHYQHNPEQLREMFSAEDIYRFTMDGTYNDYWWQVLANSTHKIKTWWVFFYATVFLRGGLTLYPKESHIRTIGCDGSGVHCGNDSSWDVNLSKTPVQLTEIPVEENKVVLERYKIFFNQLIIQQQEYRFLSAAQTRQIFESIIERYDGSNKRIILFGTGAASDKICSHFSFPISYFVDNNNEKWGSKYKGRPVHSPQKLLEENKDHLLIVVAIQRYEDIAEQLKKMGFAERQHYWDGYLMYY